MIISSKKYACETCIKGHRSSACKHTDRPLFEIKKKGRPVTQCEHCRELRKTKQVHVKCICESKAESSYSLQQGPKAGFESAAFPNGLPEALGASVAFPSPLEGTSSDSDHGGVHRGHQCKSGDPCTCVTPRTRRPRGNTNAADQQQLSGAGGSSSRRGHASSAHTSSQILARIQELRPLVPRPPSSAYSMSGPVHNPSMGIPHGHTLGRHHDNFAPYGRVHGTTPQHNVHPQSYAASPAPPSTSAFSYNEQQMYPDPLQMMGAPPPWGAAPENVGYDSAAAAFPSLCGCGDDCACPGCVHHNRATRFPPSAAYSSCSNPHLCATCLDCTIMSLPATAFLPDDTALSISDDQNAAIDDWLRQMSASIASSSDPSSPFHPGQQGYGGSPFQQQQQQPQSTGYFPYNDPPPNMGRDPRGGPPSSSNSFSANANYPSNPNAYSPPGRDRHQGPGQGFPSSSQPRPGHRSQSSMSMPGHGHDASMIDPRLLPTASPAFHSRRSRSPSASSSSSQSHHDADATIHHGSSSSTNAGRPSGRMQGLFPPARGGGRAPQAPQLHMDIHPGLARGPGSAASSSASASSVSPSPGSARAYGGSAGGPNSNPNAETGEYDPSLAGLQIY